MNLGTMLDGIRDDTAERTLLGALLADATAIGRVMPIVGAGDFANARHAAIFGAVQYLDAESEPVDLLTVRNALQSRRALEVAGGVEYVAELMEGMPRVANVERWAHMVREKALLRRLVLAGQRIAAEAAEPDADPATAIDRAQQAVLEIAGKAQPSGWHDNRELFEAAFDQAVRQSQATDGIVGLRTGLCDLDAVLQGIRPGQLVTIAARLGQGKTILGLQIADAVVDQGMAAAFFSLEMSGPQLMKRRMSAAARVSFNTLHRADVATRERRLSRLAATRDALSRPGVMVHTSAYTIPAIRSAVREAQATTQHPLGLIVVDYIQLMEPTQKHDRGDQVIAELSRGLKRMAKDLGVPVVALSQLNRVTEARSEKRPSVGDIAEGDSIGRDSDVVILIHREDAKGKTARPGDLNTAELIVGKNRDGWEKPVKVRFNRHLTRFENLASEEGAA